MQLLKAIEKELPGDTLSISIAPYNRLKTGLKDGEYQMIGHTPFAQEVKEFYDYAEDVNWKVQMMSDIISLKKENLNNVNALQNIGTPRGNKEFAAELTGIPMANFYDNGSIETLLSMLKEGRINAFWFPRATTLPEIKKMKLKVYYKAIPEKGLAITFSTSKTEQGKKLKEKFETALKKVKWEKIFKESLDLDKLPASGEY